MRGVPTPLRRCAAALIAVAFVLSAAGGALAQDEPRTGRVPALVDVHERTDEIVAAYAETHGRLAELGDELEEVRAEIPVLELQVTTMHHRIQRRAATLYKDRSSGGGLAIFDDDPETAARRSDLGRAVAKGDSNDLVVLRETKERLDDQLAMLETAESEQAELLELLEELQDALQAELLALTDGVDTGARLCPVQGPVLFTNDWGQPRSDDRTHQGTDIFSPSGAENVTVVAGTTTQGSEELGGLVVYLRGDDGNVYYYAHLSRFEGPPRRVEAGEVIGYTGDTGNALGGTPHTHFEVHEDGADKVNPYPILRNLCDVDATDE